MFDLNIENYSEKELFEIFQLNESVQNTVTINSNFDTLKSNIMNSNKTRKEKENTIEFITQVKNKLIMIVLENNKIQNPLETSKSSKSNNLYVDKLITVDTRFANIYNNDISSFTFDLTEPIRNIISMDLVSLDVPNVICIFSKKYKNNFFTVSFGENISYVIEVPEICVNDEDLINYDLHNVHFINLLNNIFSKHQDPIVKRCSWSLEPDFEQSINTTKKVAFNFNTEGMSKKKTGFQVGDIVDFKGKVGTISNIVVDNVFDSQIKYTSYTLTFDYGTIQNNVSEKDLSSEELDIEYVELDFTRTIDNLPSNNSIMKKFGWIMGYKEGKIRVKLNNKLDKVKIVGYKPLKLVGPKYLYLVLDEFSSNKLETIVADKVTLEGCELDFSLGGNILAKFLFDGGSKFYSVDRIITTTRHFTGPVDIQKMKIALIDEYGRVVDLVNSDWSFSLRLNSELIIK